MSDVPRLCDCDYVAAEYADDARLTARAALWSARTGPHAPGCCATARL